MRPCRPVAGGLRRSTRGEGMTRKRILLVALVGVAVFTALALGGGKYSPSRATAPAKDVPVMGSGHEELGANEAYWNNRLTYPTGRFNPAWLRAAARQNAHIPIRVPAGGGSWVALGPQPERMDGCQNCYNYHKTEGRINAIVVDPTTTTNGSIVAYAASVGGGVWKTTNCCSTSTTWSVTTDNDPLLAAIDIDTLAIDPADHNTIYAGTGDLNFGSFSMGSQGILKSTDAGAHWTLLGASVFGPGYGEPPGQYPQYDAVGKVRVDPNNSSNVVAGTKKGLFFSYDGGTTWSGPCLTNAFTTQRQDVTGLELANLGDTTRIIAAIGTRGFGTAVQYDLGQNGANGLYPANMASRGCPAFSSIAGDSNGFVYGTQAVDLGGTYAPGAPMRAGSGVAFGGDINTGNQLGRIDLALAPGDPNVIYAQVQTIAGSRGAQLGMWQTNDGGAAWHLMTGSSGHALDNDACGGDYHQNWYAQALAA